VVGEDAFGVELDADVGSPAMADGHHDVGFGVLGRMCRFFQHARQGVTVHRQRVVPAYLDGVRDALEDALAVVGHQ